MSPQSYGVIARAGMAVATIIAAVTNATATNIVMRLNRPRLLLYGGTEESHLKSYNEAKYARLKGLAQLPRMSITGSR